MSPKKAKPAPPAKKKKAQKTPASPAPIQAPAWKIALSILALAALGWQFSQLAHIKIRQRIRIVPMGQIAAQGRANGNVSAPVSIKAGPEGTLFLLSHFADQGFFIQKFNAGFSYEKSRWFETKKKQKEFVDPTCMTVLPDSSLVIAERSGKASRFDADFKKTGEFKLALSEVVELEASDDGGFYALDPLARKVIKLNADGSKSGTESEEFNQPGRMTLSSSGNVAVLDQHEGLYLIRVLGPNLKALREIPVPNVHPSPPDYLAAGANDSVALNNSEGSRGVLFYDLKSGDFIGETLGVGQEAMLHPGFCAGDRKTGDYYLHFGVGLQKCRLPLE